MLLQHFTLLKKQTQQQKQMKHKVGEIKALVEMSE